MTAKKFILPALAATTLAGGVAGYFYLNRPSGDATTPLGIAKVVPGEAYMATFISTDDKNWAKLKQFGTPEIQQEYDKSLKEFQQKQLIGGSNLDIEKDLKPWMGNMIVAMMPSSTPNKLEALIAIAIKDKTSALSFANKLKSDPKVNSTETDYKGTKINAVVTKPGQSPSYTAVLQDSYLVIASNKTTIEHSIDTVQGGASFATKPEAASFLTRSNDDAVVANVYIPDYAAAVQGMIGSGAKMDASSLAQLKQVKSMVGTVAIEDVGLRFKGTVQVDPKIAIKFKPAPGKIVARFPSDTFALVSGSNLSSYWNQFAAQSKDNPETQKIIDMMRGGTQMVGLDLDNDIFGWMNGEFAIGMVPQTQGMMAQLGLGQAIVVSTSNRKTAEAALSKLDTMAKARSLQVVQRDVNGKKITEWQTPQGALVGHGWLSDDTMFIAIGDQLTTALSSQPNPGLETSDNFKAATASLPKQNVGYFYMDVDKTMSLLNKATQGAYAANMTPLTAAAFNSIKSVGGTTTQTDKTTSQFEAVIALKPAK